MNARKLVATATRLLVNVEQPGTPCGSRWLEGGWPIHHVKEMLGHANMGQTDTYLNVGRMGLHESMKRFDDARCKTIASRPPIDPGLARNERLATLTLPTICARSSVG